MQIPIQVGNKQYLILGALNCVELCEKRKVKDKATQQVKDEWIAVKWFNNVSQALTKVAEMKVNTCDAKTLVELARAIEHIREEMKGYYKI